jgi:hypothetical protein
MINILWPLAHSMWLGWNTTTPSLEVPYQATPGFEDARDLTDSPSAVGRLVGKVLVWTF